MTSIFFDFFTQKQLPFHVVNSDGSWQPASIHGDQSVRILNNTDFSNAGNAIGTPSQGWYVSTDTSTFSSADIVYQFPGAGANFSSLKFIRLVNAAIQYIYQLSING